MARKKNTGRKRSAKSRPRDVNRQHWSSNDRLQLLAYLEWCVQYGRKFDSTAVAHLKKVTGKQFSERGIRDKLKREWTIYGKCDTIFEELFSEGLDALHPLEDDDQVIVQHIFDGLEAVFAGRQTRSASAALAIRSRTLSATRSTRATSSPKRTNPAPSSQKKVSKKPVRKTYSKVKQKRSTRHKGTKLQMLTQSVQKNRIAQSNSARQNTNRNLSADELATDHDAPAVKSEDESELSAPPSPGSSDVALERLTAILDSQDEDMIDTPEPQPVPSVEANSQDLKEEIVKLKGHNFTLTNRLAEAHNELEAYHDRHGGPAIAESDLKDQIIVLKTRLEAQVLQKREFEGLTIDRLGFQKTSFKDGLKQLFSTIDHTSWMICDFLTIDDSMPKQRTDFDQLAQSWVAYFYDGDLGALLDHSNKAGVSKKKLLATLLTAGVFELVLKPVFPSILTLESPLLDEYRKHILTQGKCTMRLMISTHKKHRWMARTAKDRSCCHKISHVRSSPQENIYFRKSELAKFTHLTHSKILLSPWKK